jgi:hypothetical protein
MRTITVREQYQRGYSYMLTEPTGKNFHKDFNPDLSPKEMLTMGIFGGNYFHELPGEFPSDWFKDVTFSKIDGPDPSLNYFKVNASQPLSEWLRRGWINEEDPKGWFLWYCRYYLGRRIKDEDERQIKRWKAINRHRAQLKMYCEPGDLSCRPRQRQALLHWSYDSTKI